MPINTNNLRKSILKGEYLFLIIKMLVKTARDLIFDICMYDMETHQNELTKSKAYIWKAYIAC